MFKNRKHTDETKQKMRQARVGIVFTQEHKNNIKKNHSYVWKGQHLTDEQKKKISLKHKGRIFTPEWKKKISQAKIGKVSPLKGKQRPNLSGPNHYNWKGGHSFGPYSIDWKDTLKRSIKERDKYTCQICDKQPEIFAIHHIDYNKLNCDPENLITLCLSCHAKTNTHRDYWQQLLTTNNQ
jgi:5-methylcytosine-specific restriction endonuclease McrA